MPTARRRPAVESRLPAASAVESACRSARRTRARPQLTAGALVELAQRRRRTRVAPTTGTTRTSAGTSHGWSVTTRSCTGSDPPERAGRGTPGLGSRGAAGSTRAQCRGRARVRNRRSSGCHGRCRAEPRGVGRAGPGLLDGDDRPVHPAPADLRDDHDQAARVRRQARPARPPARPSRSSRRRR